MLSGCRQSAEEREAPTPVAPPRSGPCVGGGGVARYDAELFDRTIGEYCVDPHGETRAYGSGAAAELDDVCVELFDGECEVYKRHGLERVTMLRYVDGRVVDGRGSMASVSVTLARFSRRSGAYGSFMKRALRAKVRPLQAGAAGALGSNVAYVWRGRHVLELRYVSEIQAPGQLRESSARALPRLAEVIGERLPGDKGPLAEVALLPEEHLLPLGAHFASERLLGVRGTGQGAIGHYRDGARRWRVLVAIRDDEQGAGDLLHTLSHGGQGWPKKLKHRRAVRARFASPEDQALRVWYLARRGRVVVGVGDEEFPPPAPTVEPTGADLQEGRKLQLLSRVAGSAQRFSTEKPAPDM